jgi:hypothetical protein
MATANAHLPHNLIDRQLAALEYTYPIWQSRRHASGMWSAVRATPPSDGGVEYVVQPSAEDLAAFLGRQLETASGAQRRQVTVEADLRAG